MLLLILK